MIDYALFDKPLPKPVSPFVLMAKILEDQEYTDHAQLAEATAQRDRLYQLAAAHPYVTQDGHLALLIAGCAINPRQRQTVMSLASDQAALDLVWALEEG